MFVKLFFIALVFYLAIDLVWITVVAKRLYKEGLSFLTREKPKVLPGILLYPLLVAGLTYFVIHPSYISQTPSIAALTGAFFGLVAYGSYNLTNFATIKNWPSSITFIDMVWGTVICSITSALTYFVALSLGF